MSSLIDIEFAFVTIIKIYGMIDGIYSFPIVAVLSKNLSDIQNG